MMSRLRLLMSVASMMAATGGAAAQPPSPPPAAAAAVDAKAVVAEVRRLIAANYVLPDMRPKLDAALAAGLASGRYGVADPAVLAERLNADLAATGHDKHLN